MVMRRGISKAVKAAVAAIAENSKKEMCIRDRYEPCVMSMASRARPKN